MDEEIKNFLFITISLLFVFLISLFIGLSISSFKNINNANEQTTNQEKILQADILNYTNQINNLNNEKQLLINKISDLKGTSQNELVQEYNRQINNINKNIVEITKKLVEITKNSSNSSLIYNGKFNFIYFANFDINDNYIFHTGYSDTKNDTMLLSGQALIEFVRDKVKNFDEILPKSKNSSYETLVYVYDFYDITIQNETTQISILNDDVYSLNKETILKLKIKFNNIDVSYSELIEKVDNFATYNYSLNFDYLVGAESIIDMLICNISITSN